MFEQIVLGAVQGIAEWLPVSSEGMIVLVKSVFFGGGEFEALVKQALFLHLGTFLAALVYFRKDVAVLLRETFRYQHASEDHKKTINFLVISTLISGAVGFTLLQTAAELETLFGFSSKFLIIVVGVLLLITGFLQLAGQSSRSQKQILDMNPADSVLLGVVQGFAALPGLSRSGLTVSAFLLRKYDKTQALRLSFLMSLPIVLAGNIILNLGDATIFSLEAFVGLASAFVFGYMTIEILMRVARKINFGWFVLFFAVLTLFSVTI